MKTWIMDTRRNRSPCSLMNQAIKRVKAAAVNSLSISRFFMSEVNRAEYQSYPQIILIQTFYCTDETSVRYRWIGFNFNHDWMGRMNLRTKPPQSRHIAVLLGVAFVAASFAEFAQARVTAATPSFKTFNSRLLIRKAWSSMLPPSACISLSRWPSPAASCFMRL